MCDPADFIQLQQLADQIRDINRSRASAVIQIGRLLQKARRFLPGPDWKEWLKSNFAWTQRTAENYLRIADRFGDSHAAQYIALSALYFLARTTTPPEAVHAAIAQAQNARFVTLRDVKEIAASFAPAPPKDQKNLSQERRRRRLRRTLLRVVPQWPDRRQLALFLLDFAREITHTPHTPSQTPLAPAEYSDLAALLHAPVPAPAIPTRSASEGASPTPPATPTRRASEGPSAPGPAGETTPTRIASEGAPPVPRAGERDPSPPPLADPTPTRRASERASPTQPASAGDPPTPTPTPNPAPPRVRPAFFRPQPAQKPRPPKPTSPATTKTFSWLSPRPQPSPPSPRTTVFIQEQLPPRTSRRKHSDRPP